MKILLVARLYSGFEESLEKHDWNPSGLPSMYNFINYFNKAADLHVLLTAKDSGSTYKSKWKHENDLMINLPAFKNSVCVLSGINYFPYFISRKIAMILRDIRQFVKIVIEVRKTQPDIIYCDSANVIPAALLSIFSLRPVVLRVLGACSYWWSIVDSKRLIDRVYRFAYRAPFNLVIGTEDGSGMQAWFDNILRNNTTRLTILNGVDSKISDVSGAFNVKLNDIQELRKGNCKIISFVGRLETYKGVDEFFNAALSIINEGRFNVHFLIVGDGSLYKGLIKKTNDIGADGLFTFFGSVEHMYINNIHSISDIYVSTNYDGNLTNANLEAIENNQCMLIVDRSDHPYIDISTRNILDGSVIFFKSHPNGLYLKNALNQLLVNPVNIDYYKNRIRSTKRKFMKTWVHRMDEEFNLLNKLVRK